MDPDVLHDGNFAIKLKPDNSKFEARLKYFGFPNWTEWISSERRESSALYLSKDIVTLLPVIVIAASVLIVVTLLTICIVKRKHSQLKYDAEVAKADEDCQELQKQLNDKYFR